MLDVIRMFFADYPDRKAFFYLISTIFPRFSDEYMLIEKAYRVTKDDFRGKYRETGDRYFEHLRAVALILILHLRIYDANIIVAALLHDIIENVKGWNYERVVAEFNHEVALLVCSVSKKDKRFFNGSKAARNLEFNKRMLGICKKAALIKLADRLHNILTLWATSQKKQFRIIKDTRDYYLEIAKRHNILVVELTLAVKCAIDELGQSL